MSQAKKKKYSPTVLGAAIGLPIGICLYVLVYVLTFAAGSSLVAYVFPFAMIANPGFYDPWWLTLFFALIQFPVYGAAYGFVWARKRDAVWIAVGCLVVTHIAGLAGATSRLKTYNEQRWQQIHRIGDKLLKGRRANSSTGMTKRKDHG